VDFFHFVLPAGTDSVEIEFRRDGETTSNIELSLTDNTGALLSAAAALPVTLERDTFAVTVTGQTEAFLQVRFGVAPTGIAAIGYAFLWRAVTFDQTHEPDNNNTDADARGALAAGVSVAAEIQPGNDDRYLLTGTTGQVVNIVVTFSHAIGNIDFQVRDNATPIVSANSMDDNESVQNLTLTGTGPFYVRVFVTGIATSAPYTLYWNVVG
jgi:hypothetical protein